MADVSDVIWFPFFLFHGFAGQTSNDGTGDLVAVYKADGAPGGVEVNGSIYRGDPDDDCKHGQLVGPLHSVRGTKEVK